MLPFLSEEQVNLTYEGYCGFLDNRKNPYKIATRAWLFWQEGFDFSKKHNKQTNKFYKNA